MAEHAPAIAHHFEDAEQQRAAGELGMWLFLVTEFMFFGGLFLAYFVYRHWYPAEFAAGSRSMDVLLGTINTALLLTSSLTMALAVEAAHRSARGRLIAFLLATILLGSAFLGIKSYEYHHKYEEHLIPFGGCEFTITGQERRGVATFLNLYFLMTGLHATHMVIGIVILLLLLYMSWRRRLPAERGIIVHNTGLYWHFVDLVWVYLFPFFYLISACGG